MASFIVLSGILLIFFSFHSDSLSISRMNLKLCFVYNSNMELHCLTFSASRMRDYYYRITNYGDTNDEDVFGRGRMQREREILTAFVATTNRSIWVDLEDLHVYTIRSASLWHLTTCVFVWRMRKMSVCHHVCFTIFAIALIFYHISSDECGAFKVGRGGVLEPLISIWKKQECHNLNKTICCKCIYVWTFRKCYLLSLVRILMCCWNGFTGFLSSKWP